SLVGRRVGRRRDDEARPALAHRPRDLREVAVETDAEADRAELVGLDGGQSVAGDEPSSLGVSVEVDLAMGAGDLSVAGEQDRGVEDAVSVELGNAPGREPDPQLARRLREEL